MCQTQRDIVPAPSALAMPSSSPAGQGGAGVCFFDLAMSAAGSLASSGEAAKQAARATASGARRAFMFSSLGNEAKNVSLRHEVDVGNVLVVVERALVEPRERRHVVADDDEPCPRNRTVERQARDSRVEPIVDAGEVARVGPRLQRFGARAVED